MNSFNIKNQFKNNWPIVLFTFSLASAWQKSRFHRQRPAHPRSAV
jgi:hypothetical protein